MRVPLGRPSSAPDDALRDAQEDGAEFPADGFAAPAALPAAAESWDDKYPAAPPTFDAAPVAGQWSDAAAPGWDAGAAPVAPPVDFAAGGVDFAAAYQAR